MADHDLDYDRLQANRDAVSLVANADYAIGQKVYLRVGDEDARGIVTGMILRDNRLTYLVVWSDRSESSHYDYELTADPIYPGTNPG